MPLTLILGPMKSGKSMDLITRFAPLQYTNYSFAMYQPSRNVRDQQISTRNGINMAATKVHSLREAIGKQLHTVGVDEMHMFPGEEADAVAELLKEGAHVIISSLDTDYQGLLFEVIKKLFEIGPDAVHYRRAACDICRSPDAIYTQVLKNGVAMTSGLPPSVPDDGTFQYKSVCRDCFVRPLKI